MQRPSLQVHGSQLAALHAERPELDLMVELGQAVDRHVRRPWLMLCFPKGLTVLPIEAPRAWWCRPLANDNPG